jgi:predicted trehalose synthase
MADSRSTWNDAGERFQALGDSLKQHYLKQRESEADRDKEQAADAFTKVGDALQAAFDALASAANDPAVKHEVKQAGISVADALSATFAEISEDLSGAFDSAPPAAEPGAAERSPQDQKDPGAKP